MPDIGMVEKQFQVCPESPNCASSMANLKDKTHYIEPIRYTGSREKAMNKLRNALNTFDRQKLIKADLAYWHYEFRTAILRFRDNVEFYFPERQKVIHMRSASEMGYSDMGANRKRLESIREAFHQAPDTDPEAADL